MTSLEHFEHLNILPFAHLRMVSLCLLMHHRWIGAKREHKTHGNYESVRNVNAFVKFAVNGMNKSIHPIQKLTHIK